MAAELRDIRSAAIDGRMHNPFFQKEQLKSLHDILCKNLTEIQASIAKDHRYTQAEASVEYWLALRCIAQSYKAVDPKRCLQAEYAISNSEDSPNAREPIGIVVIEPAQHTFFYSLISALVPALVHGNCIIVQAEKTLLESPKFILSLLNAALDDHVFKVVYTQLTDSEISSRHARIIQKEDEKPRVVAIVERDADLQIAAKAIASARFSLRGKSPCAPDLVLVNEWVKKDFLSALVQHTSAFMLDGISKDPLQKLSKSRFHDTILKENLGDVVFSTQEGDILNVQNRNSPLIQSSSEGCYLAVHCVTSMDDAIDVSRSLGRLRTAYIFSSPQAAKYISQFIDSQLTIVNHIPLQLLYEPKISSEISYHPGAQTQYSPSLFTLPKPQYINDTAMNRRLRSLMSDSSANPIQELNKEATNGLPEEARPAKMASLGFFEQGFITGAVLMLSGVLIGLATFTYHGNNYLRSRSL